ncbi:MAG: nucleotide exchange factor GrpE [Magnetococcales bacterium]|nr:nucleotide exchange factor GrpE [Magnetococcales bacterium]
MTDGNDPQQTGATAADGGSPETAQAEAGPAAEAADSRAAQADESGAPAQEAPAPDQQDKDSLARIQALEEQVEQQRHSQLRVLAEMDNLRKRTEREKDQARKFALEAFVKDLLPVADSLDRAMAAVDHGLSGTADGEGPLVALRDGVDMTRTELMRIFNKHGVTRIEAVNQPFDPQLHQAMMHVDGGAAAASGTVVQELQSGYLLNERLIRPAMVGVAR